MVSRELLIWTLTGAETTTWGILARTSATLMEAPAGLMPMRLLAELGRTNMSIPMPFCRVLKPLSLPMRMAVMERIMMTSIAMARQLMSERRGRWTRLPATNLFILITVYWKSPPSLKMGGALQLGRHLSEVVRWYEVDQDLGEGAATAG